jgi:alpha-methylacyl-CoA racemase
MLPLNSVRVIHVASLGPGPFAAMLLADLGADVVIVDRTDDSLEWSCPPGKDPRRRGQRSIRLDLKSSGSRPVIERLIRWADVLIEGMRPGVAERLRIGPEDCAAVNQRLIYARATGWGQTGPLAQRAAHDLNYLALSGALHAMGPADRPPPVPLNLLGDYAGGGAYLAFGITAALTQRERNGRGEVIDAAIIDGVASLTAAAMGMIAVGRWSGRESNLFDGGAPFYRTYESSDHRYVAVGAIEPRFYEQLLTGLGLDPSDWPRDDRSRWPALAARLSEIFRSRTRDEWAQHFEQTDGCVTAVLSFDEAPRHPHHQARRTYVELDAVMQPAPAPRFASAAPARLGTPPEPGADTGKVLRDLGFVPGEIRDLEQSRAVAFPT